MKHETGFIWRRRFIKRSEKKLNRKIIATSIKVNKQKNRYLQGKKINKKRKINLKKKLKKAQKQKKKKIAPLIIFSFLFQY